MTAHPIEVTVRIPGKWAGPSELIESLPAGCRVTPESLILPDETEFEINFRDADDQFVSVFASSCRVKPTAEEREAIENYSVQICLTGAGGSEENAKSMMRAAMAILQAGGSGVFIDNSGLAFGATEWCRMTEDGTTDATSFAFVSVIRGKVDVFTMGLHVLGFPDLLMRTGDISHDGSEIIEMIQYLCRREAEIGNGHVLADLHGPRFVVATIKDDRAPAHSPMFNPWGRLRLTSAKEISDSN